MSTPATDPLPSTVSGELTTALIPTVTKIDTRLDVSPISVVLAVSIVCILSPITVTGNSIILAAFYRYKRLRTASNYLLVSLAVSDFGVGVFMPFGMQLELSGLPENGVSTLCIVPYCIVIALCSVSVLVTVAIAVDRLTSLAQPLRYKNIITHSSIEKYIAVFWIYAIAVGLSPLIYVKIVGVQSHSGNCRFGAAVLPPVRVFLVVAVWAPSALVLLGCYMHQTQTLALPRYGQTLAVTVGAFLILWLPFQTCMLLDIFCGTKILTEWAVVWLGLPIMAHSGVNPWIYAFHHGEMRVAAGKITEELVALFGVTPSRYGCSPMRRGSNTNMELAEVNNSNEGRRHPVEDCFAVKQNSTLYTSRRCLDVSGKHTDISPERNIDHTSSENRQEDIIEENIHDLTMMLDLKHLRRLNHKKLATLQMNTMSDPMLSADSPTIHAKDFNAAIGLSSEVNLRLPTDENVNETHRYSVQNLDHNRYDGGLAKHIMLSRQLENQKRLQNSYTSLSIPDNTRSSLLDSPRQRMSPKHMTITSNKLANLVHQDHLTSRNLESKTDSASRVLQIRRNMEILKHSESINTIEPMTHVRLLEPYKIMETLAVPTVHSEPPSPIDPLPLASLQEEDVKNSESKPSINIDYLKSPMDYSENHKSNKSSHDSSFNNLASLDQMASIEPIDLFEALLKNSEKCREGRLPEPIFAEHDSTRFSSRRPSDSKWSESSRMNNFQVCNSGSDLNDLTSLDPFMCPDALTSSLRESFFSAPSVPDSEIFTSFEDESNFTSDSEHNLSPYDSKSTINLKKSAIEADLQSKSTELRIKPGADYILKDMSIKNSHLAPLATPTPTEICTPTFELVSEIKSDNGVGVRV
ncbi:Adenosine receptor A2b [Apis cerana cerana]|uniref:Adenosine receptor A2b n=1 Tax=Apis cerana cerana TaxID=94128 RepID=A0A2A3EL21_APICC|nr:Adenosine receptor A2b [Apis cerana cerana]